MPVVYILLGILGVLALGAVIAMVFFKLTIGRRDSWRSPEEKTVGSGEKRALFLFQPSNGRHNLPLAEAVAGLLAGRGYTVTMNYPSEQLKYAPENYDLLVFASPVYMGETSKALRSYLQSHPVTGKRALLFVTGMAPEAPELEALKLLLPDENEIYGTKVSCQETTKLLDFVNVHV